MMESFFDGRRFADFEEFNRALTTYQQQEHVVFTKHDSKTVESGNRRLRPGQPRYKEKFVYAYIKYGCKHYGKQRKESKGIQSRKR